MSHSILTPRVQTLLTIVAVGVVLRRDRAVFATAGLAEWEITTPGGNQISHIDPLKERYGTCLRQADDHPGVIIEDPRRIYVDHLEWWQYYPRHVVGQGSRGFFIFDESSRSVDYFKTEQDLTREIGNRHLADPISERHTPVDGWNDAWMPAIRERCAQIGKQGAPDAGLSDAAKEALRRYCDQVK